MRLVFPLFLALYCVYFRLEKLTKDIGLKFKVKFVIMRLNSAIIGA